MSTIVAIITAPGEAAIAALRISGSQAWQIAEKITGKNFTEKQVQLAWIKNEKEKLDQVLVIPFKKPRSFTGEDVIEIHSHGGFSCINKILELVLEQGARLAKAGEFSAQAVLNGKMNLTKAEAINDLIFAKTDLARKNALNIYQGKLGHAIKNIREQLLNLLGEITASIDFPDEVGNYDVEKFKLYISTAITEIEKILETEKEGEILRNGYKVALVGKPNAGKSTLLNALLKKDRAIVTDIAGTTRDTIEEFYNLDGFPVILIDTAGLRTSTDRIEQIGIEKTKSIIQEADLIIELIDLSVTSNETHNLANALIIGTKSDLTLQTKIKTDLNISAKNHANIDKLKEILKTKINEIAGNHANVKINHRQADLLRQSKGSLEKCLIASSLSEDFWTIDLRQAIQELGEITGETLTEEILDNIFSRFCIGK